MGCCLIVVLLFIAMAVGVVYFTVALIILDIALFLMVISGISLVNQARNMEPSKMICPNCNSNNIKLSTRNTGSTSNGYYYGRMASWSKTIQYQRIAECKDCGYTWDYITDEDIAKKFSKANSLLVVSVILFALCLVFTVKIMA